MSGNGADQEATTGRTLSRIGRKSISVPSGVEIEIHYGGVIVKGPRGTINQNYHPEVTVKLEQDEVLVERLSRLLLCLVTGQTKKQQPGEPSPASGGSRFRCHRAWRLKSTMVESS